MKEYNISEGERITVKGIVYVNSNGLIYVQNPKTKYYRITRSSDIISDDGNSRIIATDDNNPFEYVTKSKQRVATKTNALTTNLFE